MSTATAKKINSTNTNGSKKLYSYGSNVLVTPGIGIITPVIIDNTYTIPANTFSVGDSFRISIGFLGSVNASNVNQTKLKIGSVDLLDMLFNTGAGGGGGGLNIIINGYIETITSSFVSINVQQVVGGGAFTPSGVGTTPTIITYTLPINIANNVELSITNPTGNGGAGSSFPVFTIEKI